MAEKEQDHLQSIARARLVSIQPLGNVNSVREFDVVRELCDDAALEDVAPGPDGRILLYGRPLAQKLLARLTPQIQQLPKGAVLIIRLDQVRVTGEFAHEMVRNLVCREDPATRLIKEKIVVLANPDEGTKIVLHWALDEERDACMVLETAKEPWKLWYIGRLQPHLAGVLDFVRSRGQTTSKDIAIEFGFQMADASRRLKELYEDGLLRRTPTVSPDGKLTFTYTYFHPSLEFRSGLSPEELPFGVYKGQF